MPGVLYARVNDQWVEVIGTPTAPPAATQVLAYRHVQTLPSDTWTIVHALTFVPSVVVVDSTGRAVWPEEVYYISLTEVQVHFSAAVAGEAFLS